MKHKIMALWHHEWILSSRDEHRICFTCAWCGRTLAMSLDGFMLDRPGFSKLDGFMRG